jgi:phage repressor protein C with HTH and peptisase S24 domain
MGMEAHERLKQARLNAGYRTATEAAKKMGVKVPTYSGHENGSRKFDADAALLYGKRYNVSPGWLLTGEQANDSRRNGSLSDPTDFQPVDITMEVGLPVLGEVAAGVWLELDPIRSYDEPLFEVPVPVDRRFPRGAVYGLLVRGTSLNKIADDGDILVCLDRSAGFAIADDDLVIVERIRTQDGLREVSAKRVRRVNGHKLELWPQSTDPRHQEPLSTTVQGDDDHTRVIARVEWIFKDIRPSKRR